MACRSRTPIDCSLIWSHSRRSARYLIEHRAVAAPGSVPVSHHLHGRRRQRCGARSRRCAVDHGARGERGWTQYATDVRRDGEGGERRADDHGHSESGHGRRWSAAGVTVRRERRGVVRRRAHRVVELDERDAVAGHPCVWTTCPGWRAVSTRVTSTNNVAIVVERTMRWDASGYGAHAEKATAGRGSGMVFRRASRLMRAPNRNWSIARSARMSSSTNLGPRSARCILARRRYGAAATIRLA